MAGQNLSKTFVWIILALLIVGLAGFGAINIGGTLRTIGTVGTQVITVDEYFRELQRDMRTFEQQAGQPLTMAQAQALGLDQRALTRLVSMASLDNEVAEIGISIGDEKLQEEILEIPAFQGINGQFDRESYRFALAQANMNEIEFETDMRKESARTLVQGAILAGVKMPSAMVDTMVDFIGARRSFVWAKLDGSQLLLPIGEPTEEILQTYYDDNSEQFMLPETKQLSYVLLSPEMILDQVDVDDTAMRALYEQLADKYNVPERRLVERLVFGDESEANSAMAQLEVGGATFETLVQNRGLNLGDIDLGDVTVDDLGDAAETVFAGNVGDVLGPLPTSLGPALFRINGILAARVTSFEDATPELRDELAADRARRLIELQAQDIDDLLAAGATLDELVAETDMQAGQIDWTAASSEGIAAYDAFRDAAAAVKDSDFPAIVFLEDGGVFALQLDKVLPARPEPFADARGRVVSGWTLKATEDALQAQANNVILDLATNGSFSEAGLAPRSEVGLTRTAYIDGTPADFMTQVFTMEPGEMRVIVNEGSVLIVRFNKELPAEQTAELESIRDSFGNELNQALSQELFNAFVQAAQLRASPVIDQQALNAVQASLQ
jgi:peptidyl-prolyl cis-trans isomerase D